MARKRCQTCMGQACEENCGAGGTSPVGCRQSHAGPDSHKVCTNCGGRGHVIVEPEGNDVPDTDGTVNYMDLGEFRYAGFLQEANRRFFHPLGLALEWDTGWTREGLKNFLVNQMKEAAASAAEDPDEIDEDDIDSSFFEAIWEFIARAGLDKPRLSGVWDYRHDPEGMSFAWSSYNHDVVLRNADMVNAEFLKHIPARRAHFGERGMEPSSPIVTSIQALPRQIHTSTCEEGPNHPGPCR